MNYITLKLAAAILGAVFYGANQKNVLDGLWMFCCLYLLSVVG